MEIRAERAEDHDAIRDVQRRAFPTEAEARLVERLRAEQALQVSVVALERELVVSHAAFSCAQIEFAGYHLEIGALGPVATLPEWQHRGAGAAVIRAGLERCWGLQCPAVIVLGTPAFYGRFGFIRADTWEIRSEFPAPPSAFMIAWSGAPHPGPGLAKYHPAFSELGE